MRDDGGRKTKDERRKGTGRAGTRHRPYSVTRKCSIGGRKCAGCDEQCFDYPNSSSHVKTLSNISPGSRGSTIR